MRSLALTWARPPTSLHPPSSASAGRDWDCDTLVSSYARTSFTFGMPLKGYDCYGYGESEDDEMTKDQVTDEEQDTMMYDWAKVRAGTYSLAFQPFHISTCFDRFHRSLHF